MKLLIPILRVILTVLIIWLGYAYTISQSEVEQLKYLLTEKADKEEAWCKARGWERSTMFYGGQRTSVACLVGQITIVYPPKGNK